MRPTRLSLALLVAVTTLGACGGGGEGPVIPTDVAEGLAARADTVAQLIEDGDGCAAQEEAAALRGGIEAQRGESITEPLATELLEAVSDLEAQIECAPPDPPDVDEDEDEGDRGRGEGRGEGDNGDDDDDEEKERGGNERKNEKKDDDDDEDEDD